MKFYWPEGKRTVEYEMGACIRGIMYEGRRPLTCTFEPMEMINYIIAVGQHKAIQYLHTCLMAVRK